MSPRSSGSKAPFAPRVLIVDDEAVMRRSVRTALTGEGYDLEEASEGLEALQRIEASPPDLVVLDLRLGEEDGAEVLERIRRSKAETEVVMLTAVDDVSAAVRCMKLGAADYIQKPFDVDDLRRRVREALDRRVQRGETRILRKEPVRPPVELLAADPRSVKLRELVARVAASDELVLIRGESGTGKEVVARALHAAGPRAAEPFVTVDCTTLNPTVIESELFGHLKGAFTGAESARTGLLAAAGRGTVFLDEIGELPPELQPKLLRAIQQREVRPVGGTATQGFEARVVAATNRDLEAMVRDGKFREDLFWRLNVVTIDVPPLRERRGDIVPLARLFLKRFAPEGREVAFEPSALQTLAAYDWPGNVRELENTVRRLLVLHPDAVIGRDDLPGSIARSAPSAAAAAGTRSMSDWEAHAIRSALAEARGNVTAAARALGIGKTTLYRKMKEYGIDAPAE